MCKWFHISLSSYELSGLFTMFGFESYVLKLCIIGNHRFSYVNYCNLHIGDAARDIQCLRNH